MGYLGLIMTAEEYLALGETAERTELVRGVVVMSPRPGTRHQAVLLELMIQFAAYRDQHKGCRVFPDVDVRFDAKHVYQPDIVCYAPGRMGATPAQLDVPPDLLVEILSPSTMAFDLTTKRDDYERFGVGEYWVVDPRRAHVRCYQRRGDLLVEATTGGDTVRSHTLEGFVLDARPLRQFADNA